MILIFVTKKYIPMVTNSVLCNTGYFEVAFQSLFGGLRATDRQTD